MKVRKKETFEAEQWFPGKRIESVTGDDPTNLCGCLIAGFKCYNKPHVHLDMTTVQLVEPGDWIVISEKDKRLVVSSEDFERIYEKV